MAGELNTEVLDDPASCRTTADWLGQVKPGVVAIGDTVYGQRDASEGFWQGTAGNAARQTLTYQGKDADTLEGLVGQVKTALETFAGEIDTVTQRMHQARTVARDGKLIVTPTAILPPGPAPKGAGTENLPPGPAGQQMQAHQGQSQASQTAIAAHEAKKRAFEEARTTVEDARTKQEEAHKALDKAMKDPLATVKSTKTYTMFAVIQGLNTIKSSTDTAGDFLQKANQWYADASTIQARAEKHGGSVGERFGKAAESYRGVADTKASYAADARKMGNPVGSKTRAIVSADASGFIKGASKVSRVGKNLVRGVPAVGTAVAIGSGAWDVAHGKDTWEATEDTAADIGGGAAGGWAGAAVGTAICPGVGTVIGGVVGGAIGTWAAGAGVDAATGE
ncbi:hypothetical protein FHX42_004018 [Saccharopolyspora lacisalsi]|uniref:Uncharacterized protein n=1 Tax=Halosaccharopolyspora lacisalsi TaxID=1000566 RepID=A0A839E156_9PSEU|nr:hypothetical protein [Halosaccharopolyspora lacisalsi]MBA8826639.1 hypothetical protein [Halosaccharopolyspora lacisalsi]